MRIHSKTAGGGEGSSSALARPTSLADPQRDELIEAVFFYRLERVLRRE